MGGETRDYSVLFDIFKPSEIHTHTHTHVLFKEKAGSNLNVSVGNKTFRNNFSNILKYDFTNNFMKFYFMKCFYKSGICFTCMPLVRALYMFKTFTYTKTHIKSFKLPIQLSCQYIVNLTLYKIAYLRTKVEKQHERMKYSQLAAIMESNIEKFNQKIPKKRYTSGRALEHSHLTSESVKKPTK